MSVRRRRALVRGRPAAYWLHIDDHIALRHPGGKEETTVPVAHLADAARVAEHRARLESKSWVTPAALSEFDAICDGART